jgi:hypothetical protein
MRFLGRHISLVDSGHGVFLVYYRRVFDEFIGVYTDANIVMVAESADFFFYRWNTEVLADDGICHVPGDINY